MRDAVLTVSPARNARPSAGFDVEADERLAGVDADAQPQRRAAERRQVAASSQIRRRRADRPLGIVLVGRRDAEDADHGIADELLDDAAVGLDLGAGHREVRGQHPVDVLGIGGLRGRGEADEVAEQRGDDLALLGDRGRPGPHAVTRSHCRTEPLPGSRFRRYGRRPCLAAYRSER